LKYRKYGNTGKKLSIIGFGGMRFKKINGKYDYDECANLLVKANERGINYFDTAPFYCDDKSQRIFGEAIKYMPNDFFISTKSGDLKGEYLRKDLEKSLKIMNLDKINFYHIWCVMDLNDYEKRKQSKGAIDGALKAKEEGLIEHLVVSTHANGDEIEKIANEGLFEGMTLGYNILNFKYREKGIKACGINNLGIVTMNPLAGGVIPQNLDKLKFLKEFKENPINLALRFNLSNENVTTALVGIESMEQLEFACNIGDNFNEIPNDEINKLHSQLKKEFNELCTGCRYCEVCPKDISVSKFMYSYNQKILGNKKDALNTIKYHWHTSIEELKKCIDCKMCERKCTQHLNIIERFKEIQSWN
jgi:predicted aldo/keto reductase-like oxidoreductase